MPTARQVAALPSLLGKIITQLPKPALGLFFLTFLCPLCYSKNEWTQVTHAACPLYWRSYGSCWASFGAPQNWCNVRPVFLSSTGNNVSLSLPPGQHRHSFRCLLAPARSVFNRGAPLAGAAPSSPFSRPAGQGRCPRAGPCPTAARLGGSSRRVQRRPGRDFWAQTPCSGLCPLQGAVGARRGLWPALLHGGRTGSQRCASESPCPLGSSGSGTV